MATLTSIFSIKLLLYITILFIQTTSGQYLYVGRNQLPYNIGQLSEERFRKYVTLSDIPHLHKVLSNILLPRIVGTNNHTKVRDYIQESLRQLDWIVKVDSFYDNIDILNGEALDFHNIIATLNPNADRFLVLSCHYDSKYMPNVLNFIGATDSAVPCAIMLNLAHVLHQQLQPCRQSQVSLMLIFLDGEESLGEWRADNSLYGARHLAEYWEKLHLLDGIDIFVLLDLLGAENPKFYSFYTKTHGWYLRLASLEERLAQNNGKFDNQRFFDTNEMRINDIIDDHVPFMHRQVPIIHLIPQPIPNVWHTILDDASVIDLATTEKIALILRLFVLEYLLPERIWTDNEDNRH